MGLSEYAVALLLFMAALKVSTAAVYKVGDDAGWTILGRPDYNKWAASKTFHVGDTIGRNAIISSLFLVLLVRSLW